MRTLLFTLTLLPAALAAQASGGTTLALPHGFSIDPVTLLPGSDESKVELSDTGIDGTLPPPLPPGLPDFTSFLGGVFVDVDALSLGIDWVVANSIGEAVIPPTQWGAITWTVTRATIGTTGMPVHDETLRPDGAAADVFGYVIPGSALPPPLVGVPFRSQDSPEIAAAFAAAPGNLDAHDIYSSLLYYENPGLAFLLPDPTVYFSVSAATVASIPAAWTTAPGALSGATVFATTWSPSSMSWSPVTVAYTAADFGIDPSEDLDALALDLTRGYALFSTDKMTPPPGGGARDPILFTLLGSLFHWTYRLPGGTPISSEVGLEIGPDDIDGICSLDPGDMLNPSPIELPLMVGSHFPPIAPFLPNQLQASMWRSTDVGGGQHFAQTWMTGWPPPGNQQLGIAISAIALNDPLGPWLVHDVFVRPQPQNQFGGHPESSQIPLPTGIVFSGQELYYVWAALGQNGAFDMSLPVQLIL